MNLLENILPSKLSELGLSWDHLPPRFESLPGGGARVTVPAQVDYFQSPLDSAHSKDDAPYLWMQVEGDFVARAHVRPAFDSTYDAGVIMARHDSKNWAKVCYESTDLGTKAAVSVVTRGVSDDANGPDLNRADVWLQMARLGDTFALHYSLDGQNWRMTRLFRLDVPAAIKVGIVAQCPSGQGTTVDFLHFSVDKRSPKNIRAGA